MVYSEYRGTERGGTGSVPVNPVKRPKRTCQPALTDRGRLTAPVLGGPQRKLHARGEPTREVAESFGGGGGDVFRNVDSVVSAVNFDPIGPGKSPRGAVGRQNAAVRK